eukprot:SAG22_NODE_652_length_8143_cov_2.399552_2_plen_111_part_00
MLRSRNGTVMVQTMDTPKELQPPDGGDDEGIDFGDVVQVLPADDDPAEAYIEVGMGTERAGTNRLHIFVWCQGEVCTTTEHSAVTWNITNGESACPCSNCLPSKHVPDVT